MGCLICFKDIICTQWALVGLLVLLFAVYITPKVLVIVISGFLSRFIPCILTVQRFGFIWARGVSLTFINGECLCVDVIHLSSSLWNTKAKTLVSAVIAGVEFRSTDIGLFGLIKTIQRQNDAIRTCSSKHSFRNNAMKSWKTRLFSFISVDISSIQLVILSTKFLDDTFFMNCKNTENSTRNDDANKSVCYHCLIHIIGSSNVYQPIHCNRQTNFYLNKTSKFALTLRLTKLTMLFHVNMKQAHLNLRVYHICGKLLCIPLLTEAWLNNDDLLVKNWNLLFENACILNHIGLRLHINIHLEPSSLNNTSSPAIGWFVRSIDLKVYGLRVSILEELIDLLDWKLYATQFGVLTAPPSTPFSTISSLPMCSRCHRATCQDRLPFLEHPFPFNKSSVLSNELSNIHHHYTSDNDSNMLKTNFQCVQQLMNSIKFCISFLPLKFYNFDKHHQHHPFEQQFLPSESSQQSVSYLPEMGFYFEIIRYSFKRSLQFYFTSSHLSTEINLAYPLNDSQTVVETPQVTSNSHTSSSSSSPLSGIILSDQLIISSDKVGSKSPLNYLTLQNFRFCLNDLHLLNGWNSQAQYCLLDIRINLIEVAEQLESSLCNTYLNILHPCIIYVHDDSMIELKFYEKLLSINYLIGRWFRTLCQSSGISGRSTIPMTTNISLSTLSCQKDTYQEQSNFMTQQNSYGKKFIKLLEYFGLNTRQLNARIHFGGVDEDRTKGYIRNNSNNNVIICEVGEFRSGFDEAIHYKPSYLANSFHKQQQRYNHDGIVIEGFQSKKIPQILFVFMPHLNSPALQFGFTNSFINFQFDFHEVYMNKAVDFLNSTDFNFTLSNLHACLLDKIYSTNMNVDHTSPTQTSNIFSLYASRCNHSDLIYSYLRELPTLNNHYWGDLFYVHGFDIWNHQCQIDFKLTTLRIEWPSSRMNQLVNYMHWYCKTGNTNCTYNQCNNVFKKQSLPGNFSKSPIRCDGFVENINVFFISSNNSFLMLRVDSQRFTSHFHPIYPVYQPMKLDGLSQITIIGTKLIYNYIKSVNTSESDVSSSFSSSSTFSPSSSPYSLYHYEIVSCSKIKDDLVLSLPELRIDIKFPEQSLEVLPNESGEFFWSLAFHLCCYDLLQSWKQFSEMLFARSNCISSDNSLNITNPLSVSTFNKIERNNNNWHLSIKPIQSYFQLHFKLLTNNHSIIWRIKHTLVQYTTNLLTLNDSNMKNNRIASLNTTTNNNNYNSNNNISRKNPTCIVGSRLKVNCEHATIICDDQTIAVFQNLKICQRPENIQHRTEHLKMGLITRANLSWQVMMQLT
ncbi:hypothetical protein MN116_008263 [Schistosoma mekongi]|uniref:Uncharacterized protein n=1 Tax=Schistosoma mekongi TaxID=38744 RepID=A0AAE1Z661_SCHME|nr:hypothetical protein MN116_008263 [Schistosoma mekongi]